jgi:hypothetical protein
VIIDKASSWRFPLRRFGEMILRYNNHYSCIVYQDGSIESKAASAAATGPHSTSALWEWSSFPSPRQVLPCCQQLFVRMKAGLRLLGGRRQAVGFGTSLCLVARHRSSSDSHPFEFVKVFTKFLELAKGRKKKKNLCAFHQMLQCYDPSLFSLR